MASLNQVTIMGNLTRDPELRFTPAGTAVANLGMALNRRWRNEGGELQEETTFVDITVWGKDADTASKYLHKADAVLISGRLTLDTWQDKDGDKRTKLKITAERLTLLPNRQRTQDGAQGDAPEQEDPALPGEPAANPPTPPPSKGKSKR